MKILIACVLLMVALFGVLVNEAAEINYELAIMAADSSEGSDSANSVVMQRFGFADSTGTEISEPNKFEKIQALIISL